MPQPFSVYLKSSVKRLLPVGAVELLQFLRTKPVSWDDAAVALHDFRREARVVPYPQYLYGLMAAARTARAVGCPTFTAIEFGVAGGNGLVAMERHADWVRKRTGVAVGIPIER